MSPQEQAQQIVNAWIAERQRKDRQCWMEPKHTDVLATLIASALAASAAKEPSMNVAQEIFELKRERDALTAKLQAVTKHIENHYCAVSTQWCSKHAIYHGDSCAVIASPEARATGEDRA